MLVLYSKILKKKPRSREIIRNPNKSSIYFGWHIQKLIFKLMKNSPNGINMIRFVSIDQDIISVNNHKNFQFLYQYFVDITLKAYSSIRKAKQHYLIFKITHLV